jgi:hypothetical protein
MLNVKQTLIRRSKVGNHTAAKAIRKIIFYVSNRHRVLTGRPPLLIYQMGKVGSSSIHASVNTFWKSSPVYHLHVLSAANLAALDRVIRDAYPRTRHIPEHLIAGEFLRHYLPRGPRPNRWPIITLVRDPIARNVSSFFQDLTTRHTYLDFAAMLADNDTEGTARRLINAFLDNHDHQRPLKWFDMELRRVFGIDVFAEPFDKQKGFTIYRNDRCRVLLIKLESLDRCVRAAFEQFLNINDFKLQTENVSRQKKYGQLYDAVKRSINFPEAFIDRMYTSRLVQHLYTNDEIAVFRRKWGLSV